MRRGIMLTLYSTALLVFVKGWFSSLIQFSLFSISPPMLHTRFHLNAAFLRTSWRSMGTLKQNIALSGNQGQAGGKVYSYFFILKGYTGFTTQNVIQSFWNCPTMGLIPCQILDHNVSIQVICRPVILKLIESARSGDFITTRQYLVRPTFTRCITLKSVYVYMLGWEETPLLSMLTSLVGLLHLCSGTLQTSYICKQSNNK